MWHPQVGLWLCGVHNQAIDLRAATRELKILGLGQPLYVGLTDAAGSAELDTARLGIGTDASTQICARVSAAVHIRTYTTFAVLDNAYTFYGAAPCKFARIGIHR